MICKNSYTNQWLISYNYQKPEVKYWFNIVQLFFSQGGGGGLNTGKSPPINMPLILMVIAIVSTAKLTWDQT